MSWWTNNYCCLVPTKLPAAVSPALRLPACVLVAQTCCCFAAGFLQKKTPLISKAKAKQQNSKAKQLQLRKNFWIANW